MRRVLGPIDSFWIRHSSRSWARACSLEPGALLPGLREGQLEDRLVEVVAAEAGLARAREHLVHHARHVDERAVEGAAAEVVDQHVLALAGDGAAEAVGVLEPGGRRLVQQREHLEAGAPEGVEGEEALVVGGVRGHAHRDFERLAVARARVRARHDLLAQPAEVPGQQIGQQQRVPADLDPRLRAGVGEEALEGAQDRPVRIPRHRGRVVAVADGSVRAAHRGQRRHRVAPFVRNHRVVAAVHHGGDGVRGPEVDSQPHRRLVYRLRPPATARAARAAARPRDAARRPSSSRGSPSALPSGRSPRPSGARRGRPP